MGRDNLLVLGAGLGIGFALSRALARRAAASGPPLDNPATRAALAATPLRLHIYDHCPFCVRVELALGWLGIPYTRRVYGYGNDSDLYSDDGPKSLTGKKMLPVLEIPSDGDEKPRYMPESGDIIKFINESAGVAEMGIVPQPLREDVKDWIKRLKEHQRVLCRPRVIQMPVFDWAKKEDVQYAKNKYSKQGFDYDACPAKEPAARTAVEALLVELDSMLSSAQSLNRWGLGWDDLVLLPELRTLSCVKGLVFPPKVAQYIDGSFETAACKPYFASAL